MLGVLRVTGLSNSVFDRVCRPLHAFGIAVATGRARAPRSPVNLRCVVVSSACTVYATTPPFSLSHTTTAPANAPRPRRTSTGRDCPYVAPTPCITDEHIGCPHARLCRASRLRFLVQNTSAHTAVRVRSSSTGLFPHLLPSRARCHSYNSLRRRLCIGIDVQWPAASTQHPAAEGHAIRCWRSRLRAWPVHGSWTLWRALEVAESPVEAVSRPHLALSHDLPRFPHRTVTLHPTPVFHTQPFPYYLRRSQRV